MCLFRKKKAIETIQHNQREGTVVFEGMECDLYRWYIKEDMPPCLRIKNSEDIQKAENCGFYCAGYPDEWVRELSMKEYHQYQSLLNKKEGADNL